MNILVVAAHPDDEVLGCGGTMARLAAEGHRLHILILGEGATSRSANRRSAPRGAIRRLRDQAVKAARLLGAREPIFVGLPDNRFDTVALLDVTKSVEAVVERVRPEVVFTQHGGDLNVDHAVTYRAVLTATRPLPGQPVRAVYAYEVASSTEWAFQRFDPIFKPSLFFDISATLDRKVEALRAYEGEGRRFPHPRSPEAVRASAQRWGSVAGLRAAEAFEVVREIR